MRRIVRTDPGARGVPLQRVARTVPVVGEPDEHAVGDLGAEAPGTELHAIDGRATDGPGGKLHEQRDLIVEAVRTPRDDRQADDAEEAGLALEVEGEAHIGPVEGLGGFHEAAPVAIAARPVLVGAVEPVEELAEAHADADGAERRELPVPLHDRGHRLDEHAERKAGGVASAGLGIEQRVQRERQYGAVDGAAPERGKRGERKIDAVRRYRGRRVLERKALLQGYTQEGAEGGC